ncbi:hypothetical protein F5887DRAFT_916914 [Amanita rubescens]|nr:hypothetical protein F5887DRAFT_916914 [Amanita rubescens]
MDFAYGDFEVQRLKCIQPPERGPSLARIGRDERSVRVGISTSLPDLEGVSSDNDEKGSSYRLELINVAVTATMAICVKRLESASYDVLSVAMFNTPPQREKTPPVGDSGSSCNPRNVRKRINFWRSRGLVRASAKLSRVEIYFIRKTVGFALAASALSRMVAHCWDE